MTLGWTHEGQLGAPNWKIRMELHSLHYAEVERCSKELNLTPSSLAGKTQKQTRNAQLSLMPDAS